MSKIPPADLDCLFPVYVTTKAPVKVLEDLVTSSANAWLSAAQVKSPFLLSVFRNKAEVSREKGRLKELATLSGTKPPVPETQEYDFLNANLYDLAMFTLESFPDRYYSINNRFMLIVDEGSVTDRTCILAEIPAQFELDANKTAVKKERKFNRRDEYVLDPKGWIDENGEETAEEELKVVRVTFEDANLANMLDDDHEVIGSLAENTYQTNGVYKEGARYPDE